MRAHNRVTFTVVLVAALAALSPARVGAADTPTVSFERGEGRLTIRIAGGAVATYVYEDPLIPRPYFCQVRTLGGVQVTRLHPPDPVINKDNDDHAALHPGLWLAFGDLGGKDFWRNKARVRHVRFSGPPAEGPGKGSFSVINHYESADRLDAPVCEEHCTYSVRADASGYFLTARSTFRSETADVAFGDQEEMGFGIRLNTPLTVKFGSGHLLNSDGGENEKGTWGRQAKWCMASGRVDGAAVSAVLMAAPDNFRPAWFHTRDYGLMVANPFGKKAMTGPKDDAVAPDTTLVRKGETFTLCFGVRIADGGPASVGAVQAVYEKWLALRGAE